MKDPNASKRFLTRQFHARRRHLAAVGGPLVLALGLAQLVLAQDPIITLQPTNQTVYAGGNATMSVQATSTNGPVTYQWQRADGAVPVAFTNIPAAIESLLSLSNVTLDDTGDYRVIGANAAGDSVTSQVAHLEVIPLPLTRITEGPVVEDRAPVFWASPTWWDYDNDGYVDLFVGQLAFGINSVSSAMYHNNGDGTFTKMTNVITAHPQRTPFGAVGDYDNDGNEDLLVVTTSGAEALFRNDGQGNFTPQTSSQAGPPVGDIDDSAAAGWADYDRDGFIDLFAANSFVASANPARSDCLYRNDGDGSFTKMTTNQVGMLVGDQAPTSPFSWVDYDNDGWPDLWVGSANATGTGKQYLWRNNSDGTFSLVSAGSLNSNIAQGTGQWADYDNDGDLDLCLTDSMGGANTLHRNDGGLTFTDVSEAAGVTNAIGAWAAAWGDFDNDGFLDLMVPGYTTPGGVLYRNNGDTTFTSINVGSPVNGVGVAWADYDNDGFLDLFLTSESPGPNFLYHNNGNGNQWLKVKVVGTASNRSAIGAKVRVEATIRGQTIWQMREISGNGGQDGGSGGLVAHFGLGDAMKVDTLRIEWPSGIVQQLDNVEVDQQLEVVECQGLSIKPLVIQTSEIDADGVFHATGNCAVEGAVCVLESSPDLDRWSKVQVGTSSGGTVELTDVHAAGSRARFYRVLVP